MDASSRPFAPEELLAEADWVWGLARSLVGERQAEDVVQETWLAALQRRPHTGRPLRPWLARVLRNQAALLARRHARAERHRERARDLDASMPPTVDLVARAELQRLLVVAVLELEEPYRSVVLLRFFENLTPSAIARQRGVPAATVRTQLRRGLARLRSVLDRESGGDRSAWVAMLAAGARTARPSGRSLIASAPVLPLVGAAFVVLLAVALVTAVELGAPGRGPLPGAGSENVPATRRFAAPAPLDTRAPAPRWKSGFPGRLQGTLIDARTREPLPHFEVEIAGADGRSTRARTNADGLFELPAEYGAGEYELRLIDHPGVRVQEAQVHGPDRSRSTVPLVRAQLSPTRDVVIECPAGPTYRLRVDLPAGLEPEHLRAHLGSPGQFHTRAWQLHLAQVRRARSGNDPWVRFAELDMKYLDGDPPWVLSVSSRGGFWLASAEVHSITGVHADPVELELRACGILSGTVRDALGPVSHELAVVLGGSNGAGSEVHCDSIAPDGTYSFPGVEPGRYELGIESPRHAPSKRVIRVEAGLETICDVVLERLPAGGPIRGTLASRSGTYRSSLVVVLAPSALGAPSGQNLYRTVRWRETDTGLQGDFAFGDVPDGTYGLRVVSFTDHFEWFPTPARVRPPASLHFECQDDVQQSDLGFRVVDARDGSELSEVTILYESDGRSVILRREGPELASDDPRSAELWSFTAGGFTWTRVPGPYPIRGFPAAGALEWTVAVPGFRPAYGDESSFVEREGGRRADVVLLPGWGIQLSVVDADSESPLQGVLVSADSRAVGRTGLDGRLRVALDTPPRRLSFAHGPHRLVGGNLEPGAPPASPALRVYEVRMRAP